MKNTFRFSTIFLFSLIQLSLGALAAAHMPPQKPAAHMPPQASPPWKEDYSSSQPSTRAETEAEMEAQAKDLQWLYEKLFSVELRESAPKDVSRTFQVHLLDTYKEFPDPADIRQERLRAFETNAVQSIQGMITYVSLFQKKYHYDISRAEDGTLVINVKIHLKNPTPEDTIAFAEKVAGAETIWNTHEIPTDFAYKFKFEIVKTAAEAPFSVQIVDSTRGPYDTFWGRDWTPSVIAHEIGHMMGLADEYQPFGKAYGCYIPSLMCSTSKGAPMPHHYYFFLRRLVAR